MSPIQLNENDDFQSGKIKRKLISLEVGEKASWPISRTSSVRVLASQLGLELSRVYKTFTNRESKEVSALRVE